MNKATSSAHATVDRVAAAADEAMSKAKPTIDRVAQMAHKAVDKAAVAATPSAEWLNEQTENLKASQQKLFDETSKYVVANPMKAIGIALAVGFVLSRIVR